MEESLVGASGTNGASFLVSMALSWELVFLGTFFAVAFILEMLARAITPRSTTLKWRLLF